MHCKPAIYFFQSASVDQWAESVDQWEESVDQWAESVRGGGVWIQGLSAGATSAEVST